MASSTPSQKRMRAHSASSAAVSASSRRAGIAPHRAVEQLHGQRAVEVLVQVDVAVQVIVEGRGLLGSHGHALEKLAEHAGDQALPAHRQGGGDHVGLVLVDEAEGGLGEIAGGQRHQIGIERLVEALLRDQGEEATGQIAIRADLVHGLAVELEMARVAGRRRRRPGRVSDSSSSTNWLMK